MCVVAVSVCESVCVYKDLCKLLSCDACEMRALHEQWRLTVNTDGEISLFPRVLVIVGGDMNVVTGERREWVDLRRHESERTNGV